MAWGVNDNAVERWTRQLRDNDPSLKTLHILSMRQLSQAELLAIFAAIASNNTLQVLYCSRHSLESNTMAQLARTLAQNHTLESLNIGTPELGSDPQLIRILADGITANHSLKCLDLENKGLDKPSMTLLAPALASNTTLVSLNLSRNKLDDEAIAQLVHALGSTHHLRDLNLASNTLGPASARSLATCLQGLITLDLSENHLAEGACAVGAALKGNTSLQTLKMIHVTRQQADLGNQLVISMAQSLADNTTLTCLWLNRNGIESEPIAQLSHVLPRCALTELHLGQNQLDDAAAHWLARSSQYLKKLELGENQIGCEGFGALLDTQLRHLGLFSNHVHGFPVILPDLQNSGIESLDVGCNNISLDDLDTIVAVLLQGGVPNLKLLEIGGNVRQEEVEAWESIIGRLSQARPDISVEWKFSMQPQQ